MSRITNLRYIEPMRNMCGLMKELYRSDNFNVAHAEITGEAEPHHHPEHVEEVYIIERGYGRIRLGDETMPVRKGDVIPIPRGETHSLMKRWHAFRNPLNRPLELIVVNYPPYDPDDVLLE
jgi:mannose-6-phosphate isomerase-like protein (cupin superfamily)